MSVLACVLAVASLACFAVAFVGWGFGELSSRGVCVALACAVVLMSSAVALFVHAL